MADLRTTADTFQELAKQASNIKDQLSKQPADATMSPTQKSQIDQLMTLAERGVSELKAAADEHRANRLKELDSQISALTTALTAGVDTQARDHIRALQNKLRAEHAQLDLVSAGDFSPVVRPDYIQTMLGHLGAAQKAADTKASVAATIPIIVNATQLVLKIAGFILAALA
jgi:uncharacterized phage infection (PIP) family protein YhgE